MKLENKINSLDGDNGIGTKIGEMLSDKTSGLGGSSDNLSDNYNNNSNENTITENNSAKNSDSLSKNSLSDKEIENSLSINDKKLSSQDDNLVNQENLSVRIDKKPKEPFLKRLDFWLKDKFCNESEVIGLEIQPNMIRVCIASKHNDVWSIDKLIQKDVINNFSIESLRKNKEVYVKAIKDLFKKEKLLDKNVAISIPTSMAIIKTINLPAMAEENLLKASKIPSFWQNLVQLSGNINDYEIYYKILANNEVKKEMDVLFIGCKKQDLKNYLAIIEEVGLNLAIIDIACFSINNLSKLKENNIAKISNFEDNREVYLKIGKDENYLQVVDNGKPDIYDIFIPENEKSFLNEYLEHQTFQQRFLSQLKHNISKYQENYNKKITKISVVSSEPNIKSFVQNLDSNLTDIKVEVAKLFDDIKLSPKILQYDKFQENSSAWAVVAGLATRSLNIFDNAKNSKIFESINLLPTRDFIKEKLKINFYSKIIFGATISSSLLILAIFGAISFGIYHKKYKEITEFNELNDKYKEKYTEFEMINLMSGTLNRLNTTRHSLNSNQENLINTLTEFSLNIPEGVWLEEVVMNSENILEIKGKSFDEKNIIDFSKQIENSKYIEEVSIKNIKTAFTENSVLVREFIISGKIISEVK